MTYQHGNNSGTAVYVAEKSGSIPGEGAMCTLTWTAKTTKCCFGGPLTKPSRHYEGRFGMAQQVISAVLIATSPRLFQSLVGYQEPTVRP